MNSMVTLQNGDRVPNRYLQASKWYDDNDRKRTAGVSNFLTNMRQSIYKKGQNNFAPYDIRNMSLTGFKFATKEDEQKMEKAVQNETEGLTAKLLGINNNRTNYVPIVYTEGWDSPIKLAYLVRHSSVGGDNTIFGMETDDGRSLTVDGTKKFLDKINNTDGAGAAFITEPDFRDTAGKGKIFLDINESGEGFRANKRGFLEALHSTVPQATERQTSTGEIGAFPSNWWGL